MKTVRAILSNDVLIFAWLYRKLTEVHKLINVQP